MRHRIEFQKQIFFIDPHRTGRREPRHYCALGNDSQLYLNAAASWRTSFSLYLPIHSA